jgi:phosphoglycolate phosphatase
MKYKAIIWDMDGTVLDTLEDLCDSANFVLAKYSCPERTLEETRCSVGNGLRQLMQLSTPGGEAHPEFENIFADMKAYYSEHCRVKTRPYDGIDKVLDTFKAAGIKMAIVSNKLDSAVKELVRDFYPQVDYSLGETDGLARKPAPDMVEKALSELGVTKEETIFIGDSEVDVQTAQNAGLRCISALWGFRKKEELLPYGADTFAEKTEDLISMILGE